MARLRKKWSRRVLAIYLIATIFGGLIVFCFILLLGLMYWMTAPAQLPDPNLLIHPKATAWLVVNANGLRDLPQDSLRLLTDGAPQQVERLVAGADGGRPCPIQIVFSEFPGEHGPEKSMAISLGRFAGQFWLVRRDLERRVDKQTLPLSLRYRLRKPIFFAEPPSGPLSALAIADCTLLRCGNPAVAETLIDRLEKKADISADRWPRALSTLSLSGFQGWAESWKEIPLASFFPADYAPLHEWQSVMESLTQQFPAIARSRDVHVDGAFHDRLHAEFQATFQTDRFAAASLAAKVNDWLASKKLSGFARPGSAGDTVELVKIEAHFGEN